MSWGADAVQGMGSGANQAGGFAGKTSAALGGNGGFSDIFKAAQEDIKRNEASKVQLPPQPSAVPMQFPTPQQSQTPRMGQYGQAPAAPPVITGFNL